MSKDKRYKLERPNFNKVITDENGGLTEDFLTIYEKTRLTLEDVFIDLMNKGATLQEATGILFDCLNGAQLYANLLWGSEDEEVL